MWPAQPEWTFLMPEFDYDLIVIGAGSGGVRAARLTAQLGKRVAVIEADKPGGTCVLRGCVPKKLMVNAADIPHEVAMAQGYGWDLKPGALNWHQLREDIQAETLRLSEIYKTNLQKAGAELIMGRGSLVDAHTVAVGDRQLTAAHILIATGSATREDLGFPGSEYAVTSDDMFTLPQIPKRALVLGAGFIALEFASVLNGFGCEVTVAVRRDEIFNTSFDLETRQTLRRAMEDRGVKFLLRAEIEKLQKTAAGLQASLTNAEAMTVDMVLAGFGRDPNTKGLNLDAVGVHTGQAGEIVVDPHSQTSVPHIYAIGDVTNRMNLTPVAIREGVAFVETVFKNRPTAFDYNDVPVAVYSLPNMAAVGLSEDWARQENHAVTIYKSSFKPMKTGFAGLGERTFIKLVVDSQSDRVLGAHMVGPDAGEMIQLLGIAVKAGLTKAQFDATCALHPTAAEEWVTL